MSQKDTYPTPFTAVRVMPPSLPHARGRRLGSRLERLTVALFVAICFITPIVAQAVEPVTTFFGKARDTLLALGPYMAIGSVFWVAVNVLRERPSGKQIGAGAIFGAIGLLATMLQGMWT